MPKYWVMKGIPCRVLRPGATEWERHVTTRELEFEDGEVVNDGRSVIFTLDGWKLKVTTPFAMPHPPVRPPRAEPRPPQPPPRRPTGRRKQAPWANRIKRRRG